MDVYDYLVNRAMSSFRALRSDFPTFACSLAYHTKIIARMTLTTPIAIPAISPDVRSPDDVLELDGAAAIPLPVEEA